MKLYNFKILQIIDFQQNKNSNLKLLVLQINFIQTNFAYESIKNSDK